MSAEQEKQLQEEIQTKIKELDTVEKKFKAVALNHYLEKKKALDAELEKEMKAIAKKYEILSQPIYDESAKIVSGEKELTEEELAEADQFLSEEEKGKLAEVKAQKTPLAGFWLQCMQNCDLLEPEIKEKDEELLKHLINVKYVPEGGDDSLNFKLVFTFSENEFFSNTELTKTFVLKDEQEAEEATSTEIDWKEGKNITVKTVKKTQKNKKTGAKRVVTKEVQDESFFNFFKDSKATDEEVDEDDEEAVAAAERITIDLDIANSFVEELIPYALEYYLGVKVNEDDYDMYGDDDEDDEDDDEEPRPKAVKGKNKKKSSSDSTKSNEGKDPKEKPECKQQ